MFDLFLVLAVFVGVLIGLRVFLQTCQRADDRARYERELARRKPTSRRLGWDSLYTRDTTIRTRYLPHESTSTSYFDYVQKGK